MQFKSFLVTLVTASAAVEALSIPGAVGVEAREEFLSTPAMLAARSPQDDKDNKGGQAVDCAAAKKLAEGIDANIKAQKGEQAAATKLQGIVGKSPVDKNEFEAAKKELLSNVNKGIEIRKNNQKIAPKDSTAIEGLGIVAKAQATEKEQAESLKGNAQDQAILKKLEEEFKGGIEQNEKNKVAALKGCQ